MSNIRGLVTKVAIKADAQGNAPTEIELLRTGTWHTPWHGDFEIVLADLFEFAANFAKGTGLVADDPKLPINYAHESWDKAAGWAAKLRVDEDREVLIASEVEWTPAAVQALKDKEWTQISPEFNPRGFPWEDPEEEFNFVENVVTGAALTNIPLFKKLKPIMASRLPSKPKKADVTSGDGKQTNPKGEPMKLEDILAKQVSERSDEETAFLSDHKSELSADQQTQLDTEATDAQAQADKEAVDKAAADEAAAKEKADADAKAAEEAEKVEAARKGAVSISASKLASLEADAKAGREAKAELDRKNASEVVDNAIKAGQVKSGEKDRAVKLMLSLNADSRAEFEAVLAGLPKHELSEKEIGDHGVEASNSASDELNGKVALKIKASAQDGKRLSYYEARQEILTEDTALAARVETESKENQ